MKGDSNGSGRGVKDKSKGDYKENRVKGPRYERHKWPSELRNEYEAFGCTRGGG